MATGLFFAASASQAASVILHWTAPGDDGRTGRSSLYDLRCSTAPITDANWSLATQISGLSRPLPYGNRELVTVSGLLPSTDYYFAVKAADEQMNWSPMSNVAKFTTCGGCGGVTGNVNASPDNRVDLVDLTILVQFLTGYIGTQVCFEEANVDGSPDGVISLTDLSLLTAYLTGHATLPSCP